MPTITLYLNNDLYSETIKKSKGNVSKFIQKAIKKYLKNDNSPN